MPTFHKPLNNVSTTVGSAYTAGSGSLVLASGAGAQFGSTFPLIITASRAGSVLSILNVMGRSSDTLTISGAIEGTTDVNLLIGDSIEMRPTALAITELQDAITANLPAGSNTQVQFNDSGSPGAQASFAYDKTNQTLTLQADGTHNIQQWKDSGGTVQSVVDKGGKLGLAGQTAPLAPIDMGANLADCIYLFQGVAAYGNTARWGFGIDSWSFVMFMDSGNPGVGRFSWRNTPNSTSPAYSGTEVMNLYTTGSMELLINAASAIGLKVVAAPSQTANLTEWRNSSNTILGSIDKTGAWNPPSMADSAAANNSVYYSTDAGKLVYKDSGGTVNALY
jgi:hypothetical protein